MKTGLWLSRRHVRWTIVLLALMPIVPTALMINMMVEAAERDRNVAISEIVDVYRDQLVLILNRFEDEDDPNALQNDLVRIFGDDVSIEITDNNKAKVFTAGPPITVNAISVEMWAGVFKDWTVSIDNVATIPPVVDEVIDDVWRQAFWIVGGVMLAAASVWFVAHRGLRVDELRSDMVTTVSHEMKTPVASMKILLETLTDSDFLDDKGRAEYLDLLVGENNRLERLAENFLTFSRLEKGEVRMNPAPLDLGMLITDLVRLSQPRFSEAGGEIKTNVPGNLTIHADRDALQMLLANLLENGLKYGGNPPIVTITATTDAATNVIIAVSDNGPGIPEKERRDVFRRFFQGDHLLHHKRKGVGLGLAICERLAKLMRGKIRVENSDTGSGARFVLALKKAAIKNQSTTEKPEPEREKSHA